MIEDAIDNALFLGRNRKGCIFLKSAGNNGTASTPNGSSISYPGDYRAEVLTVGSISKNGERSYFSSTGPALDVVAPGIQYILYSAKWWYRQEEWHLYGDSSRCRTRSSNS